MRNWFVVFIFCCFHTLCCAQHGASFKAQVNRIDVFTNLGYTYNFKHKVYIETSAGFGIINGFYTGSTAFMKNFTLGYTFSLKNNASLAPSYSFSFLTQKTNSLRENHIENSLGYNFQLGNKIKLTQASYIGLGNYFSSASLNSKYLAFLFNIGVLYVW